MDPFYELIKKNFIAQKTACRLFHGRGKVISDLDFVTVDYFPPFVLIILYKEYPDEKIKELTNFLVELISVQLQGILVQRRYLPKAPSEIVYGLVPNEFNSEIEGNTYSLKFNQSQNIGFFLDMKEGREYLVKNAHQKKILNLFSYTSAFSVVALKNGAREVINIDMSKGALARARRNHELNNIEFNKVKFFDYNILKSFGKIKKFGPYDLIIIDPPSFQVDSFSLEKDYAKIIKRVEEWLNPNGEVLFCLNSPHHSLSFFKKLITENNQQLEFVTDLFSPDYFLEQDKDSGLKISIWRKNGN